MQGSAEPPRDEHAPTRLGVPVAVPAAATLKLYAGDWARFAAWCRRHGDVPLPASADTLGRYLLAMAPTLSRGALGRRRAAINAMHRQAGLPVPSLDAAARKTVRTAAQAKAPGRLPSPTPALLARIAARCPRDLPGLRDRALLLLAAATGRSARLGAPSAGGSEDEGRARDAGAVPRRFLLALDAEHVRFTVGGALLQIRRRSDEPDPSRVVALTRNPAVPACPVRALEEWLRASDTAFGPVFRKVDRWGNVEHGRLGPDAWHRILARRTG